MGFAFFIKKGSAINELRNYKQSNCQILMVKILSPYPDKNLAFCHHKSSFIEQDLHL